MDYHQILLEYHFYYLKNLHRHGILKTEISKTTGILLAEIPAELWTNN